MRKRLGIASFLIGALSIPVAASAMYAWSVKGAGSSFVFDWFAAKGLIKGNPNAVATISEPSIFVITDERALYLLSALAISLAIIALVVALVAEYLQEQTLYLSGGYIFGALALLLFKPLLGAFALVVGFAAVMVIRSERGNHGPDT